jgi:hypothetical protein
MNDFAFVAIMLVFFALAALFVAGCDRIIGSEEEAYSTAAPGPDPSVDPTATGGAGLAA